MSKHNYSQYSNKKKHNNKPEAIAEVREEIEMVVEPIETAVAPEVTPVLMQETVDTVALPKTMTGVVVNCSKLNVRVAPVVTAEVACVLNVASEIEIVAAESTDEWFKVVTAAGIDGYCMRKFVEVHL